jgi:hypothetical protein
MHPNPSAPAHESTRGFGVYAVGLRGWAARAVFMLFRTGGGASHHSPHAGESPYGDAT